MLRLPHEPHEPGVGPYCATPARPVPRAAVVLDETEARQLRALVDDAMFSEAEAREILAADKVLIGGNWFCLLQGDLAGGPLNLDGSLDFSACCVIDMPDRFEYPELTGRALRMLHANMDDIEADQPREA
jgi:hypothetical protein